MSELFVEMGRPTRDRPARATQEGDKVPVSGLSGERTLA
jgi:hypothetical protein